MRLRRRTPYPTSGEICSSRRSLSTSSSRCLPGHKFDGLRQHPLQGFEVCRIIFGRGRLDLFWKRLHIINGGLNSGFWPLQVPGNGRYVSHIAAEQQHDFPNRQCTALNVGLSTDWGIAKVEERKFRTPKAFFDEP